MSVSAPASWSKSYSPYRTLPSSSRRPARHIISLRDLSGRLANFSSHSSSLHHQQPRQHHRSEQQQGKHRRHQSLSVPCTSVPSSSSASVAISTDVSVSMATGAVPRRNTTITGCHSDSSTLPPLSTVLPFCTGAAAAAAAGASVVRRDSVPLSAVRSHRRHFSSHGDTRRAKTENVSTDGVDGWKGLTLRGTRGATSSTAPLISLAPLGSGVAPLAGSVVGAGSADVSRFPKLTECAHFHYDNVQLGPLLVQLYTDEDGESEYGASSSHSSLLLSHTTTTEHKTGAVHTNNGAYTAQFPDDNDGHHQPDSILLEPPLSFTTPDSPVITIASASGVTSTPLRAPSSPSASSVVCRVDPPLHFTLQVTSNGHSWLLRRSYDNIQLLDKQLHSCIYDRKFSQLVALPALHEAARLAEEACCSVRETLCGIIGVYMRRFSCIAGSAVNCAPVLSWLQLDNRGNRLLVADDGAGDINLPAVAAAMVVRRCVSHAADEISLEVGDMISVIDMSPSSESLWWRGKRGFQVGFFPCQCVRLIGDKVPPPNDLLYPLQLAASSSSGTAADCSARPLLRKRGKLLAFFRNFMQNRPSRRRLKERGILKERVFGCDLGEHLINLGHTLPFVLQHCAQFIETRGIVDGVYRLSGITSNIQRLRNTFDEGRVPDLSEPCVVQDIHSVSCVLKQYFRELPNPLLTFQLYDSFVAAVQCSADQRLMRMRDVVQQLPPPHYRTLESLIGHLSAVSLHGGVTGMTAKNLAIVWAPNLVRSVELEAASGVAALQGVGVQAVVVEYLIRYRELIFSDKLPVFTSGVARDNEDLDRSTRRRHHHHHHHRPKSLAILTPTKLLSLEEARCRALLMSVGNSTDAAASGATSGATSGVAAAAVARTSEQKYIDVGGGPDSLPARYHTVIELPRRRKSGSMKLKRSPMAWRSLFRAKSAKTTVKQTSPSSSTTLLPYHQHHHQQLYQSPASSQLTAANASLCSSRSSCLERCSLRSLHSAGAGPCTVSDHDSRHSLLNLVSVLRLSPLLSPSPAQSSSSPTIPCTTTTTTSTTIDCFQVPGYTSCLGRVQPPSTISSALVSVPSSTVLTHSRSVSLDSFFDRRLFARLPYCDDDDDDDDVINNNDDGEEGEEVGEEESGLCDQCVATVNGCGDNCALTFSDRDSDGAAICVVSDCRDLHVLSEADTLHQQQQQQEQLYVPVAAGGGGAAALVVARCASAETLSRSTAAPPSGGCSESTTGDDASSLRADCTETSVRPNLPTDGGSLAPNGGGDREVDCCTEQDVERELATDSDSVSVSVGGGGGGVGADSVNVSPIKQQQQQCEHLVSLSEELGQLQRKLYTDSPPLSYVVLQAAEAVAEAFTINNNTIATDVDNNDDEEDDNGMVGEYNTVRQPDSTSPLPNRTPPGDFNVVSPIPQTTPVSVHQPDHRQSMFFTDNDNQQLTIPSASNCAKCGANHELADVCCCDESLANTVGAGYTRLHECFSPMTPEGVVDMMHTNASPSSPFSSSQSSLHDPVEEQADIIMNTDVFADVTGSCGVSSTLVRAGECSNLSVLSTVSADEQRNDSGSIETVGDRSPSSATTNALALIDRIGVQIQTSASVVPIASSLAEPYQLGSNGEQQEVQSVVVTSGSDVSSVNLLTTPTDTTAFGLDTVSKGVVASQSAISTREDGTISSVVGVDTAAVSLQQCDNPSDHSEHYLEPSCSCVRSHHDVVVDHLADQLDQRKSLCDTALAAMADQSSVVCNTSSFSTTSISSATDVQSTTAVDHDLDHTVCSGDLSASAALSQYFRPPPDLPANGDSNTIACVEESGVRSIAFSREELCSGAIDVHGSQLPFSCQIDERYRETSPDVPRRPAPHEEHVHLSAEDRDASADEERIHIAALGVSVDKSAVAGDDESVSVDLDGDSLCKGFGASGVSDNENVSADIPASASSTATTGKVDVGNYPALKSSSATSVKQLLSRFESAETVPSTSSTLAAPVRVRAPKRGVLAPSTLPAEGSTAGRQQCLLTARPFKRQLSVDSAADAQQNRACSKRDSLPDIGSSIPAAAAVFAENVDYVADRLSGGPLTAAVERTRVGDDCLRVSSSPVTDVVVVRHPVVSSASAKTTEPTPKRPTSLPLFGSTSCSSPRAVSTVAVSQQQQSWSCRLTSPLRSRVPPGLPISPHRSRPSLIATRFTSTTTNNNSASSGNASRVSSSESSPSGESLSSGGVWRRSRSPLTPLAERSSTSTSSSPTPPAISPERSEDVSAARPASCCVLTAVGTLPAVAPPVVSLVAVSSVNNSVTAPRPSIAPGPPVDRSARERIDRYKAERRSFLQRKLAAEGLVPPSDLPDTDHTSESTVVASCATSRLGDAASTSSAIPGVQRHVVRTGTLSASGRHHVATTSVDVSSSSTFSSSTSLQSVGVSESAARRVSAAAFGVELRPCVRRHSTSALRPTATPTSSDVGSRLHAAETSGGDSSTTSRSKYFQQHHDASKNRRSLDSNRKWSDSERKHSEAALRSTTSCQLSSQQTDRKWCEIPANRPSADRSSLGGSVDERLAEARRRVAAFTPLPPSTGVSDNRHH